MAMFGCGIGVRVEGEQQGVVRTCRRLNKHHGPAFIAAEAARSLSASEGRTSVERMP